MATINFTGTKYSGMDGRNFIEFTETGYYQVSDEKAAQLVEDFPQDFSAVLEGASSAASDEKPAPAPTNTKKKAK